MSTDTTSTAGRGASGTEPERTNIVKVVFASLIGTAVEWYDFFLYGSAAALVFGTLFFPESEPATATLLAFGTYALGFVARPLGGIVFGHFGDKVGRKKMLVASLFLMGLATFAIGLLPTYASIGVAAPLLLLTCRLVQGFAVGGEWGGAVLMAAEHGDDSQRGFWSSWPQAGVALGNLFATGVLWVLAAVQSDAAFESWGWRVPFLLSAVLVAVGLWVRLSIEESPVFTEAKAELETKETPHLPLVEVFRKYPKEVLVAMGMRMAENISYYLFTIISISFLTIYAGTADDKSLILKALLIGSVVHFVTIPLVGALSDRVGRRPLYLAGAVGVAAWSWVFFDLIASRSEGKIILAIVVGLVLHALMYAPQAAFFSELFGTSVRYTGASVGYQLASIFAGALAPIIAIELLGDASDGRDQRAQGGDVHDDRVGDHHHRRAGRPGDQGDLAAPRPGAAGLSPTDPLTGRRPTWTAARRRVGSGQRVRATGTRVTPPRAPSQTSMPSSSRPGAVGPETVIVKSADSPGARRTARGCTRTRCEVKPRVVTEKYSGRVPMLVTVRTARRCRAGIRSERRVEPRQGVAAHRAAPLLGSDLEREVGVGCAAREGAGALLEDGGAGDRARRRREERPDDRRPTGRGARRGRAPRARSRGRWPPSCR